MELGAMSVLEPPRAALEPLVDEAHEDALLGALAAYLRARREAAGLGLREADTALGLDDSNLVRIEAGRINTRATLYLQLFARLGGDFADLAAMLSAPAAQLSPAYGRALAERSA